MAETRNLKMHLLEAAQAQKHVTVNEALVRLDALAGAAVISVGETTPPASPAEGDAHVAGAGAGGAWTGQGGAVALYLNGGWAFVAPWAGLSVTDGAGARHRFDGTEWRADAVTVRSTGAATLSRIVEIDHQIAAGASSATVPVIPDKAVVLGVTARVTEAISGPTGWKLGTADGADRYGAGIGTAAGSFAHGVSGTPIAYYGGTALLLTAEGGAFVSGRVTLAVHCLEIAPPR